MEQNRQGIQVVKDQNLQPLPQFPEKLILTLQTMYLTNDLTMDTHLVSPFFKDVCGYANYSMCDSDSLNLGLCPMLARNRTTRIRSDQSTQTANVSLRSRLRP